MLPALEFGKAFFEFLVIHLEIVEEPFQVECWRDKWRLRQITQIPMGCESRLHESRFAGAVTTQQAGDPADRDAESVQLEFAGHVAGFMRVRSKRYKAMSKVNVAVQSIVFVKRRFR